MCTPRGPLVEWSDMNMKPWPTHVPTDESVRRMMWYMPSFREENPGRLETCRVWNSITVCLKLVGIRQNSARVHCIMFFSRLQNVVLFVQVGSCYRPPFV